MAGGAGSAAATVTRWSRAFVATGIGFFVALAAGLGLETAGLLASVSALIALGRWLVVLGAALYAAVCWTIFFERAG